MTTTNITEAHRAQFQALTSGDTKLQSKKY
jgi:hypothetical protein